MIVLLHILDWLLFVVLCATTIYLLAFALLSLRYKHRTTMNPENGHRNMFITLIPAYKADAVIVRTTCSALDQSYPLGLHRVVVIADRLQDYTIRQLQALPITLVEIHPDESSKARALKIAIDQLGEEAADIVTVLDADNLVGRDFIERINDAFNAGAQVVQTHRTAKNRNTPTAVLDAASEEINNSIFRRGHAAVGLSAALIGSGMAFRYGWFGSHIGRCATSGEDKELEMMLLDERIRIDYLDDVYTYDEKVDSGNAYYRQRRRWIAVQFQSLGMAVQLLPRALASKNYDFCDKLMQWAMPPRMLLIAAVPLLSLILTFTAPAVSVKWWFAMLMLGVALTFALPLKHIDRKLLIAMSRVPLLVVLTLCNLFRMGGAKRQFIHTAPTGANDTPHTQHPTNTPTRPLRIAIEAQRIFRTNKHGMDFVALETIRQLQRIDTYNEYFIFVANGPDHCLEESDKLHILILDCPFYPLWEQWALPRAVRNVGTDLLHCTSNTAPVWAKTPLMVTLHDIIFLERKKGHNPSLYQALGRTYRRWNVPRILPRARRIITVSEFERHRIGHTLGIADDRITAIHNGYNTAFRPMDDYRATVDKYLLEPHYLFFLGNTDPKKNTEGTLHGYAEYVRRSKHPMPLLIADLNEHAARTMLQKIGAEELIHMLLLPGYIPNRDLPAIYNGAAAFLYTSLRESFGIPLLEAMACGTPVVSSNTSAIPEVAGNGALLVDPSSPHAIADALLRLETDEVFRQNIVRYGLERVRVFSWEKTARQLLSLYESSFTSNPQAR